MFEADAAAAASGAGESGGIYMRLEVLQGTYLGATMEFTLSGELVIGRDGDCDIVFAEASLSRRHARVFTANGVVYVEDLGSQNGTYVNGAPLTMACALRSGDEIAMGDVVIRLKF